MEKILAKIYSEKDLPTNIAIFFGAMAFLYIYIRFDKDPYLGLVAFLSAFSVLKALTKLVVDRYTLTKQNILNKKYYSKLEKSVISAFTKTGTCFLSLSDLKKGKYEVDRMV